MGNGELNGGCAAPTVGITSPFVAAIINRHQFKNVAVNNRRYRVRGSHYFT